MTWLERTMSTALEPSDRCETDVGRSKTTHHRHLREASVLGDRVARNRVGAGREDVEEVGVAVHREVRWSETGRRGVGFEEHEAPVLADRIARDVVERIVSVARVREPA